MYLVEEDALFESEDSVPVTMFMEKDIEETAAPIHKMLKRYMSRNQSISRSEGGKSR